MTPNLFECQFTVEVCICGISHARIPIPYSLRLSSTDSDTATVVITIIIIIMSIQNVCKDNFLDFAYVIRKDARFRKDYYNF